MDQSSATIILALVGILAIGAKIVRDELLRKRANGHNPNAKTLDSKLDGVRSQLHELRHQLELQHEQSSAFRDRVLEVLREIRDSKRPD